MSTYLLMKISLKLLCEVKKYYSPKYTKKKREGYVISLRSLTIFSLI